MKPYCKNKIKTILVFCFICSFAFSSSLLNFPTDPDRYFSTKSGRKSFLLYHRILDRPDLASWEILLLKPNQETFKIIRRYEGTGSSKRVRWDGLYTTISNQQEVQVQAYEGIYYYTIRASNTSGEMIQSPFSAVVLDNTPPVAVISCPTVFSPNNDGRMDKLLISIKILSFSRHDAVSIEILDDKNKLVKTYTIEVDKFERNRYELYWDGTDENGEVLPSGNYFVQAVGKDYVGNEHKGKIYPVEVISKLDTVEIKPTAGFFVYENADGFIDFNVNRSSGKYWEYEVFTFRGKKNQTFFTHTNKQLTNYVKIFPKFLLPQGDYKGTAQSFYRSGNFPIAKEINFSLFHSNYFFVVVDSDVDAFIVGGKKETIKEINFFQSFGGAGKNFSTGKVRSWGNGELGEAVFTIEFDGILPPQWTWRGEISLDQKLYTGEYVYELNSKNELGEKTKHISDPFQVIASPSKASVVIDKDGISPNGDGLFEEMFFSLDADEITKARIRGGHLNIYEKNKKIASYVLDSNTQEMVFPSKELSETLSDGFYEYYYKLSLNANETLEGEGNFFVNKSPVYVSSRVIVTEKPVSLNEQDMNEIIIRINRRRSSKFKQGDQLTVSVYRLNLSNKDASLAAIRKQERSFEIDDLVWEQRFGKLPSVIKWDGKTKGELSLVPGVYAIVLKTIDVVANKWNKHTYFRIVPRF